MATKKVFAVNGSPNLDKGSTDLLLKSFLKGVEATGAKTELTYSSKMKINQCIGDFQCWYKIPGVCIHKDDMVNVYETLETTDILVLATPVYIPFPGAFQDFLNRLCPIADPLLQTVEERTTIRLRSEIGVEQIVLVSTSGWWEIENLEAVRNIIEKFAAIMSIRFAGSLLRPHSGYMGSKKNLTDGGAEVLQAAERAGRELIEKGSMSDNILDQISKPLISREEAMERSHKHYRKNRQA